MVQRLDHVEAKPVVQRLGYVEEKPNVQRLGYEEKPNVQRLGYTKKTSHSQKVSDSKTRPGFKQVSLKKAVKNLDLEYIQAQNHKTFSLKELEKAHLLTQTMGRRGFTVSDHFTAQQIELRLSKMISKKIASQSSGLALRRIALAFASLLTLVTAWDVYDHYTDPYISYPTYPGSDHVLPLISEPVIKGIDWLREP